MKLYVMSPSFCLPTALYSIHKKKVYGAKMLESQNLQSSKSKYVTWHLNTLLPENTNHLLLNSCILLTVN